MRRRENKRVNMQNIFHEKIARFISSIWELCVRIILFYFLFVMKWLKINDVNFLICLLMTFTFYSSMFVFVSHRSFVLSISMKFISKTVKNHQIFCTQKSLIDEIKQHEIVRDFRWIELWIILWSNSKLCTSIIVNVRFDFD